MNNISYLFFFITSTAHYRTIFDKVLEGHPRGPPDSSRANPTTAVRKVCLLRATAWKRGRETRARSDDTLYTRGERRRPRFRCPSLSLASLSLETRHEDVYTGKSDL